ncbi:MAG: GNAT family N-acetyltransferase [Oscillospiraceae bacterium]|nr:GNAT family N-acetyltransferase [Oscillospiraceae bacterium]
MKLNNDFSIREAVASDAAAIWRLNCSEMGYQYPLDDTAQNITKLLRSSADKIFVAVYDGSVVGYVHANDYDVLYAPHMKNIMGIAVSSEHKQQGIGRALLQQVEHWACKTGAAGIRLVSGASRTDAHEFYRRCGYSGGKEQLNLKKIF